MKSEKAKTYFERLSLVTTVGFCAFVAGGGFELLKSKEAPPLSPSAERLLAADMRPTAITIGHATLKAIAGNSDTVTVEDDAHHPGGQVIEIKVVAPDLNITMDVRMEKQAKSLKAQTTYGVSIHEEVPSQGYFQVGTIAESDGHWMGTFDSSSDLTDGPHLTTELGANPDEAILRSSARQIAANTDKLSQLTLDILRATTAAA